jgi:hypothetical protein
MYYYILASAFIFAIVFFKWFLQRDMKKVRGMFKEEDIVIASYGVHFYGLASEPGGIIDSGGQMILLKNGLYYKGRFDKRELFISAKDLVSIAVTDFHKNEPTIMKCLAFYFTGSGGKIDRAAFELPRPKEWVDAIKYYFENENKKIPVNEEYIE